MYKVFFIKLDYKVWALLPFYFAFLLASPSLLAQPHRIKLVNASFEDMPRAGVPPVGWQDCGFPGETAPDTQPQKGIAIFNVKTVPRDGSTYLGLVTRDNDSWERVCQRLSRPMEANKTYTFSLWLCRSEEYLSASKTTNVDSKYNTPVILRLWGGNRSCDQAELLGVTNPVENTRWMEYRFTLKPKKTLTYVTFEAYYKKGSTLPYNGNLLVDLASDFVHEVDAIAVVEPTPPAKKDPKPPAKKDPKPITPPKPNAAAGVPSKPKEKLVAGLDRTKISIGKTVQAERIQFKADSVTLTPESFAVIDEIYDFLKVNPDVSIEVGGHTNNVPLDAFCDRLSTSRAKNVADYLVKKGIKAARITYRGYGKRYPIADNKTPDGRRKNQRVEIKITSMAIQKGK